MSAAARDRHKHKLRGLRLHPAYWKALDEIAAKTRRTDVEELKIAIEEHCGKEGVRIDINGYVPGAER